MAKKVTMIQPIPSRLEKAEEKKLRVCAYARVSTDSKKQADSYAAQVAYYSELIEENPMWEFAGIFADEALTGTKVKGRTEFQQMIQECEDGNIDLIITKSFTRFARNTVECIQTIRKLKEIGVGIYYEKEKLNTLTEKSELMIAILSSIAQGESEDFSGNNRWATVQRFETGTYIIGTPAYGYCNDEDGNLIINPEEAEVVRWIFESYLNGVGTYWIAKNLNEKGVPTKRTAKHWQESVIKEILKNSVYEGDILHQKTYTEKTFPFEQKVNKGEVAQYLIEDNHPPIIAREEAQAVRDIIKYRTDTLNNNGNGTNRYIFSGRIICGECGKHFRRQKVYIGKPYEKIIWTCCQHVKDKKKCSIKAIREDEIKNAFIAMWNKLYTNKGLVLEPLLDGLKKIPVSPQEEAEMEQLNKEIQSLTEQCRILNQVMKKGYIDTALFMENHNLLLNRIAHAKHKKAICIRKQKRRKEIIKTEQIIGTLQRENTMLKEFREDLFNLLVKEIKITIDHDIIFCLCNGLELTEVNGGEAEKGDGEYAVAYTNGI